MTRGRSKIRWRVEENLRERGWRKEEAWTWKGKIQD